MLLDQLTPSANQTPKSSAAKPMSYTMWLSICLALTVAFLSAFVCLNVKSDLFGLFGHTSVDLFGLEHYSKSLVARRYVPENYSAVLIGNSIAANWDTRWIGGAPIYNLALRASNMTEQRSLLEQAVRQGHLKTVFVVLNPSMLNSHGLPTAFGTEKDVWASYGSIQNLLLLAQALAERFIGPHIHSRAFQHRFTSVGSMDFPIAWEVAHVFPLKPADFALDPQARRDLTDTINLLHRRHIQICVIWGPIFASELARNRSYYETWQRELKTLFLPQDRFIELNNNSALAPILSNHANLPDFVHLSIPATRSVLAYISLQYQPNTSAAK